MAQPTEQLERGQTAFQPQQFVEPLKTSLQSHGVDISKLDEAAWTEIVTEALNYQGKMAGYGGQGTFDG